MRIDSITAQKKNKKRCNLFSDGVFIGALNEEAMAKHGIREGVEISTEEFLRIAAEDNEKYAFEKALNYISYASRTEQEVQKYLRDREIDEKTAEKAVDKLKGYGYIDDAAYAGVYAESLMRQKNASLKTLSYKLRQKGIPRYVIEDTLAEWEEEELGNARALFETLSCKYAGEAPDKKRQKILRAMAAKGFEYDTVQRVLNGGED